MIFAPSHPGDQGNRWFLEESLKNEIKDSIKFAIMEPLRDKNEKVLRRLLPESVTKEIRCFVLYDHHPMDARQLDITICTKYELQEYYQRELRSSIGLNNASKIKIMRNFKCELYYLVHSNNDIIILSSKKEQISILHSFCSVHNMTLEDSACTGQVILKIIQEDDALPLVFDNNFEIVNSRLTFSQPDSLSDTNESSPIFTQLRNKFTEARYTTKCNEKTYKEYVKLRQLASFSMYQKTYADVRDSDVNLNLKQISSALRVNIQSPIVKLCNKKIVVILKIFNKNSEPMENVHILLHGTSLPSISYTTKLFMTSKSHYFKEIGTQINSNTESRVVAIIDVNELQYNVSSRLDFDVVVSYKLNEKYYLLPFESVSVSALDTMGMDFDVLASKKDFSKIILAILATSHKVDIQLRYLKKTDAHTVPLSKVFHTYLNMKSQSNFENIAIHNESPYHILHGVMVFFNTTQNHVMNVEVYTRHPSQALALIHYMSDKVPNKIIITTPEIKIRPVTSLLNNVFNCNEDLEAINIDSINFSSSIIKQIKLIKKYLFDCMKKMNTEGTNNNNRINYMALGKPKYLEFRKQVLRGLQVPLTSETLV